MSTATELQQAEVAKQQEALRPTRRAVQNDFTNAPNRWNGVSGHPRDARPTEQVNAPKVVATVDYAKALARKTGIAALEPFISRFLALEKIVEAQAHVITALS